MPLDLLITNLTQHPLAGFQFQFNKNSFMLAPIQQPWEYSRLVKTENVAARCRIRRDIAGKISSVLQVAVKSPFRMMLFSISTIRYH